MHSLNNVNCLSDRPIVVDWAIQKGKFENNKPQHSAEDDSEESGFHEESEGKSKKKIKEDDDGDGSDNSNSDDNESDDNGDDDDDAGMGFQ